MWKDFSREFLKRNRASSISVVAAALISALLLSFLLSLFYNFWMGETSHIIAEEGEWQGRIAGELNQEQLSAIEHFGNMERVWINEELSDGQKTVPELVFRDARRIYGDMPLLLKELGLPESAAQYHVTLLSQYLIQDPEDETPPLLLSFYLAVLILMCLSLILIIRNSFAMTMNERIRQLGILSSVGAAPAQIRTFLMQEAAALCAVPILLGTALGIGLSALVVFGMNGMAEGIAGTYAVSWSVHPLIVAAAVVVSFGTVLVSAWLPARRLGRVTPLEAIRSPGEFSLKKKKRSLLLGKLFGIEGELAGNALKARRRAMRTSTWSLTLSFLGFSMILCFFTLSGISTEHTYFERYQDAWDVMAEVKEVGMGEFEETKKLKALPGAADVCVYQKAGARAELSVGEISQKLREKSGLLKAAAEKAGGVFQGESLPVQATFLVMDDESFLDYCESCGLPGSLEGGIVLNQIWDSTSSNFRYPEYLPFLEETGSAIQAESVEYPGKSAEIPVLGYTDAAPVLREEYDDYVLVEFLPLSLWKTVEEEIGGEEETLYVRLLAEEREELSALAGLEEEVGNILLPGYETEIENRIQEKKSNDEMILGYKTVLGGLCAILALIGIANVFSNTLGFVRQRKRECARYLSIGMTPAGLRKMFCVEALVIAGRPILITLPLTALVSVFMVTASSLDMAEFLKKAPFLPMAVFCLAVAGCVALAYYLGGKRILRCSLAKALKEEAAD